MAKKDLDLNSLSRYSKQSPRLVLEEHGHCEVPAGCGGVVLRWRNPHKSVPVAMWLHTNGEADFFLDGEQLSSNRPLIAYGEHVLALRISRSLPGQGLLMFAGIYDKKEMIHVDVVGDSQETVRILSEPDGTWKYTLTEPSDDSWLQRGFDDSLWTPMILKSFPEPGEQDRGRYRFNRLTKFGAQGLGIKDFAVGETVWVRKSFSLYKGNRGQDAIR